MKFLPSQLAYLFVAGENRPNRRALARYLLFLLLLVAGFSVLFHFVMLHAEGQRHSWITGLYWTLVVMTTLGFGDITFTSDIGRLFSIVVLMSGVIFLLVMLPFVFIRLFYAPWLEAKVRFRAPRDAPPDTAGHVIICEHDPIAAAVISRLRSEAIPYFVIEPDPARAARLVDEGVSVVAGERDNRATYDRLRVERARLVLANDEDKTNTNITLTVREAAPAVPLAAIVEDEDSIDILQLSGATHVLPLKRELGEHLANRAYTGRAGAHIIGTVRDVQVAEVPARDTPFVGSSVRDTRLRERTGANIVGFWESGRLEPAYADTVVQAGGVMVIAGTLSQIHALNDLLPRDSVDARAASVVVIGAGVVGLAAAHALQRAGLHVTAIDRQPDALAPMREVAHAVFEGNAANRRLLEQAGLNEAASVLLTTNDDATNIYLALYCRRLRQDLRIISRVTHERNVAAIHRAGADFVLSYTSLGVDAIMSLLHGRDTVLLGEGVELFSLPVPASLAGKPLRDSEIGLRTGLSVVALQQGDRLITEFDARTRLAREAELLMLGSREQRQKFAEIFER